MFQAKSRPQRWGEDRLLRLLGGGGYCTVRILFEDWMTLDGAPSPCPCLPDRTST